MGLIDSMKEDKEALEKAVEAEEKEQKAETEALDKPLEEEKPKEEAVEEKPKEAEAVDPDKAEEEPAKEAKSPTEHARERREKRKREDALAAELATANARIAELTKPREEPKVALDPEPNKSEDPEAHTEWRIRQAEKKADEATKIAERASTITESELTRRKNENLYQQAQGELQQHEQNALKEVPDFGEAKNFYVAALAFSIKARNPRINQQQLERAVNDTIFQRAAELAAEGHENPLVAMYDDAVALGYRKQDKRETPEKEEKKPDLSKIAANKSRNSGMAGATGRSGSAEVTPTMLATMTNAEFAKLTPAERKQAMQRLRV